MAALSEAQVVVIANELGIQSTVNDLKSDTVNKVWAEICAFSKQQ